MKKLIREVVHRWQVARHNILWWLLINEALVTISVVLIAGLSIILLTLH